MAVTAFAPVTPFAPATAGPQIGPIVEDQIVPGRPEKFQVVPGPTVLTRCVPTGSGLRAPTVARRGGRSSTDLVLRERPDEMNSGPTTEGDETEGFGPTVGDRVQMVCVGRIRIVTAHPLVAVHREPGRLRLTPSVTP